MTKFWTILRSYWWQMAIILTIIVSFIFFRKSNVLEQLLQITKDSYERQIVELNRLNEEEKKKKQELQQKYEAIIKELEIKHQEQNKVLEEDKKKKIKELVETKTSEELTELLKKEFGI
jgi:endonuclease/exonuclease/phosphatase (EEP) superfamily protein YafD